MSYTISPLRFSTVPPTGVRSARTFTNFIFDFDGTLVDSARDVLDCLQKAFETCGVTVRSYDLRITMQFQLMDAIAALAPSLTGAERKRVAERFRAIYDAIDYPNTRLMPTVAALLAKLKERSSAMFIVSNKRAVPTVRILDKFNLRLLFTDVFNPDMFNDGNNRTKSQLLALALKKHSLEKAMTAYIGDSEGDLIAAKENGVLAVAVQNGYGDISSYKIRPDRTVRRIIEILTVS